MDEDRAVLWKAAAWVRGMADAARAAVAHDPEQDRTVPLGDDVEIVLGGRPIASCDPNLKTLACIPRPPWASGDTLTIRELGDILARVVRASDALCRGLGEERVSRAVAEEIRGIVGTPAR